MNDRATFLDNIAAQGVPVTAFDGGVSHTRYTTFASSSIPYGVEIAPDKLKPEWLLDGDTHIAFWRFGHTLRPYMERVWKSADGTVNQGKHYAGADDIAFVVLYPAAVTHPDLSPPEAA